MKYINNETELFINYLFGIIDERYIKGYMNNEVVYTPSNYMKNIIIDVINSKVINIRYSTIEKPLLRLELLISDKQFIDKLTIYKIIKRKINIDKI